MIAVNEDERIEKRIIMEKELRIIISGVVVTDGAHFNTTDAEGNYVLNTDPARYPMVYISTPATYELPSKEGIADGFYQYLDAGKSENQCDFVLTKRQKPVDEFVYIVLSDPQVRNEKQLDRFRIQKSAAKHKSLVTLHLPCRHVKQTCRSIHK